MTTRIVRTIVGAVDERRDSQRREVERWFIGRGVPHFIEGYRATTSVWTRAFPALLLWWLIGLAAEFGIADGLGAATVVGGGAVVVGLWALTNRYRRRPLFALPDHLGTAELALFVVSPAALSFTLERRVAGAAASLAVGLVVLAAVYVTTSYGLVAITRFVLSQLGDQLRLLASLSSRALPLLLLITFSVFFGAESWQMSSRLVGVSQVATLGLFVLLGGLFLAARAPGVVRSIESFDTWDAVRPLLLDTPAALFDLPEGDPAEPALTRGQRTNIIVTGLTRQAVQITLVASTVFAFFVVLGIVAVHPETVEAWLAAKPHVLATASLGESTFAITEELLRVSGFIAAFSGLAFTVYLVTDQTYREEFRSDVSGELRQVFAVRLAYLHHLGLV